MRKIFLMTLPLFLNAQNLELDRLRTELYSKSGTNVLKKIELSLALEGKGVKDNEKKIIDGVNTVISGFFYEDIFTEIGKNNFKKTLEQFLSKKHKIKLDAVYILSLNGVEKFDLEEFKRFLQNIEQKEEKKQAIPTLATAKIDNNQTKLTVPQILSKLDAEEPEDNESLNPKFFELSKEMEKAVEKGNGGFELELDDNQSQP